jgi:hypothetical protein
MTNDVPSDMDNVHARVYYSALSHGPLGLSAQNHATTFLQLNEVILLIQPFLATGVLLS